MYSALSYSFMKLSHSFVTRYPSIADSIGSEALMYGPIMAQEFRCSHWPHNGNVAFVFYHVMVLINVIVTESMKLHFGTVLQIFQ